MVYFDPGKKSILRVYAVVFLTAVIHNVWNAHAVQKEKKSFCSRVSGMLIKYRCVCIQSFIFFKA